MKKSRLMRGLLLILSIILLTSLLGCSYHNAFTLTTNVTNGYEMKLGETKELSATLQSQLDESCTIYHPGLNPIQLYVIEVNDTTSLATLAVRNEATFEAHESKTNTIPFTPDKVGQYRFIAKAEITLNNTESKFYQEYIIDVSE